MPYSKDRKTQTKLRIIRSAYRLFAAKGFEATSIEEIMRDCSLTRGGFYGHFSSKSHLYREAINHGTSRNELARPASCDEDWLDALFDEYLGSQVANGRGSRLAFLATDVGSADPQVRAAYTGAFKSISEKIFDRIAASSPCDEESILAMTAMIIGAVAIAQTTDDPALQARLLSACRQNAKALLRNAGEHAPPAFFWAPAAEN